MCPTTDSRVFTAASGVVLVRFTVTHAVSRPDPGSGSGHRDEDAHQGAFADQLSLPGAGRRGPSVKTENCLQTAPGTESVVPTCRVVRSGSDPDQSILRVCCGCVRATPPEPERFPVLAETVAARGLMIATRDTGPYEAVGLTVINPWDTSQ